MHTKTNLEALNLPADEIGLLNLIRAVKSGSGFGEVLACIKDRRVGIVKKTETVLI